MYRAKLARRAIRTVSNNRLVVLLVTFLVLSACTGGVSSPETVLYRNQLAIAAREIRDISLTTPPDRPIRVTVYGHGIDVKVARVSADSVGAFVDAPNRRLGVETVFLAAPHEPTLTLRIASNDHSGARGHAEIVAVALPTAADEDHKRIAAARLDAEGCRLFPDIANAKASAKAFASAATLHASIGSPLHAGLAKLQAAGVQYVRLANWDVSAKLASQALASLETTSAAEHAAYALRLEGAALDQLANASAGTESERTILRRCARDRLTGAYRRFEKLDNSYEAGYALNYRGVSFDVAGERQTARTDFLNALQHFRRANDRPAQALSLQSLALQSHQDGRLPDAMREFELALELIPRGENPGDYAHTLHNSALPLRTIGRFDEAIKRFDEAGRMLHELGDRDGEARALHGLGTTFMHAGEPDRAIELLQTAIDLRGVSGSRREQAASFMALGESERLLGRVNQAVAHQEAALTLASAPHELAQARLFLARAQIASGRLSRAREELLAILQLPLPSTHLYRGLAFTELGALDARAGQFESGEAHFAQALDVLRENSSDLEHARALVARAASRLRAGRLDAAIVDGDSAIARFETIGLEALQADSRIAFRASYRQASEIKIGALVAKAEESESRHDPAAAQRLLRTAFSVSEHDRAQQSVESEESSIPSVSSTTDHGPAAIYDLLAGKRALRDRLQGSPDPDYGRIADLTREIARLRTDAMVAASDRSRVRNQDSAIPLRRFTTDTIPAVPAKAIVAEFYIGADSAWVFELRRDRVSVRSLGSGAALEKIARELHAAWRDRTPGAAPISSHAFASRLFRGLSPPEAGETMYLIPDGPLHIVPMSVLARQAMPQAAMGSIETVASLHSTLIPAILNSDQPARLVAVIADPIYTRNDPRIRGAPFKSGPVADDPLQTRHAKDLASVKRLPSTAVEAKAILDLATGLGPTFALTGADATRTGIQGVSLGQFRIVHFATHAYSDSEDPALSTLALSRFDRNGNPVVGDLRAFDIGSLGLHADLVVLSACDTALGREISGEAPIGLARAFLRGGARSVLATLWQVPDTATARLMEEFYRQLLVNRRSPAAALELAQSHIRNEPRWSDPYYWAGFQLVSSVPTSRVFNNVN